MTITKQPSCNDTVDQQAITVAEAVDTIRQLSKAIEDFLQLPIRDCLNRTLYEDLISPIDVPAHNNSAMDGYAVSSQDLPDNSSRQLSVVGTAFAGKPYEGDIKPNQCIRIMTGAMVPAQTDCIVIQEDVNKIDATTIEIGTGHKKNQNLRFAGEDIKQGSSFLKKGATIKAADLGVMASLGIAEAKVCRKPRVSFFSTGDEIKSIGEVLGKGEIYDSNRYSLHGLLSNCHVDIIDMGVIKDKPDDIRQALLAASRCSDIILTSGGVSVGEADYIKGILQEIGDMDFWKIAMKPGRPLTFGKINNALFFGLPGNPVAVMVTFYQFVMPGLHKILGKADKTPLTFKAISNSNIRKSPGRKEFQRAIATTNENGELQVALTGRQGSGILTSMSQANCFIVLDEDSSSIAQGDTVNVQFFEHYY